MEGRNLVYFVSDVHLGLDVADPAGREARFVRFLESIPKDRAIALYMLGDIWDFWYEYRDLVPKGYVRVFSALQGCPGTYCGGADCPACVGKMQSLSMRSTAKNL